MTIKRAIAAAERSGLGVTSIEVKPDGSVIVRTVAPTSAGVDEFAAWEGRL